MELGSTSKEYLPSRSVIVPFVVPFTTTFTPKRGFTLCVSYRTGNFLSLLGDGHIRVRRVDWRGYTRTDHKETKCQTQPAFNKSQLFVHHNTKIG